MESWRSELYHYGIRGQQWGIRRGPPYPINNSVTNGLKRATIGLQFFAKSISDLPTVRLPKNEYAHVMSEVATHISEEQGI